MAPTKNRLVCDGFQQASAFNGNKYPQSTMVANGALNRKITYFNDGNMFVYNFHLLIKCKKSQNTYEKVQEKILYIKEKGEFRVQDTEPRKFFPTN